MCRVIGDMVMIFHDLDIEPKHIVIADALRTAMTSDSREKSKMTMKAMELAIKTLETWYPC
ncbi:cytoplasmic protein [Salmonella enterica subsp. enterica serovar Eastbourne]|nr:cytoplasmic protein [Salmonella enterica subsp. enterica serovar Eastbourne]